MTIREGILYADPEGVFKMREGLKFIKSAKGAFGKFPHVHLVSDDGKTRCGRKIPDTWTEIELDLEGYYDAMTCSHCFWGFTVLEKIRDYGSLNQNIETKAIRNER